MKMTVDDLLIEAPDVLLHHPGPGGPLAVQAAGASPIDIRGDRRRTGGLIPGALVLPRNPLESRCDLFSCENDMFGVPELAAIECH